MGREKINLWKLLKLIKWLIIHRKEVEEFMSQVQFTVSIVINSPAPPPLNITPSSGSATFDQDVANSVVLGVVSGGVAPYSASVDPASPNQLPPGLSVSIDSSNNLVLSGTPTVAGTGTVVIDVTDSATGAAVAKIGVSVT